MEYKTYNILNSTEFNKEIDKAVKSMLENQENIIKEIANKGYNYLVIKRETTYENNKATMKFNYKGFDSFVGLEALESEGYEVFDLTKVKEYLKR